MTGELPTSNKTLMQPCGTITESGRLKWHNILRLHRISYVLSTWEPALFRLCAGALKFLFVVCFVSNDVYVTKRTGTLIRFRE